MSYLEIIRLVVQLLPMLIQAIQTVEAAVPQSGQGAQKIAAVKSILQSAWTTGQAVAVPFEQAWPALQGTISALVSLFNSAGSFKQSG
jgi:hypothetical protein